MNTKLFFIGRRATIATRRADPGKIRALRDRAIVGTGTSYKSGAPKKITLRAGLETSRAAKIIAARRRNAGDPPLTKKELADAVRKMIAARLRSRAFLASGFLPGIKALEPFAELRGAPRKDKTPKTLGRAKGSGRPARATMGIITTTANIMNSVGTEGGGAGTANTAMHRFAGAALQQAFDHETKSMMEYIARKLAKDAQRSGIRTA